MKSRPTPSRARRPRCATSAEEIDPGLYALSWQEADKGTVVHVDDFAAGHSRSYYTTAGHDFVRMAGALREVTVP